MAPPRMCENDSQLKQFASKNQGQKGTKAILGQLKAAFMRKGLE